MIRELSETGASLSYSRCTPATWLTGSFKLAIAYEPCVTVRIATSRLSDLYFFESTALFCLGSQRYTSYIQAAGGFGDQGNISQREHTG